MCCMQFQVVLRAHLDLHPETLIGFVDSVERRVITVIPFKMTMRVRQNLAGHSNVASYQNGRVSWRPGQYRPMFHALYRKNRPNHLFYQAPVYQRIERDEKKSLEIKLLHQTCITEIEY